VAQFVTGWIPTQESIDPVAFSSDRYESRPETFFFSIFAHGGLLHLGMNMLALLSLGPFVERGLGHARFTILYLVSGMLGNVAHAMFQPGELTVGASGAIFGLLGVVLVLSPTMTVLVLNLVPAPILIVGALYAVLVPYLTSFNDVVPIAHEAHIGGMVGGILFAIWLKPRWALIVAPAAALIFLSLSFLVAELVRSGFDLTRPAPYVALAFVVAGYAYLVAMEKKESRRSRALAPRSAEPN
jgi:membrane associated rhomboid family serine protease